MNEQEHHPCTQKMLSAAIRDPNHADLYFLRTKDVLEHEHLNPPVVMEVFPRAGGVLCGMCEALALLRETTPQARVESLPEGSAIEAKEVVLRISARYLSFGLYETALLGILSQESGWATAARAVVDAAAPVPVISFGARHVHPDVSARLDYAAIVGGCSTGSTTAGTQLAGREPSGTMPHAMILVFGDTLKAVQAFNRWVHPDVHRIALVDTFHDEPEESLRVAEALGDRLWGVRLDTPAERGHVTPDLVREVRARLDQRGFGHVKIVVSGGVDPERIRLFRTAAAPIDAYGVGSAISAAPPIDFTADIKEVSGKPIAKRGRVPGITRNPRLLLAWPL